MLYSMNDPIEGDDDGDEGQLASETRTVTRHKGTGKFVKNAPTNPMHGKPTGKASGSGAAAGVSGKPIGAGVKPATRSAPTKKAGHAKKNKPRTMNSGSAGPVGPRSPVSGTPTPTPSAKQRLILD